MLYAEYLEQVIIADLATRLAVPVDELSILYDLEERDGELQVILRDYLLRGESIAGAEEPLVYYITPTQVGTDGAGSSEPAYQIQQVDGGDSLYNVNNYSVDGGLESSNQYDASGSSSDASYGGGSTDTSYSTSLYEDSVGDTTTTQTGGGSTETTANTDSSITAAEGGTSGGTTGGGQTTGSGGNTGTGSTGTSPTSGQPTYGMLDRREEATLTTKFNEADKKVYVETTRKIFHLGEGGQLVYSREVHTDYYGDGETAEKETGTEKIMGYDSSDALEPRKIYNWEKLFSLYGRLQLDAWDSKIFKDAVLRQLQNRRTVYLGNGSLDFDRRILERYWENGTLGWRRNMLRRPSFQEVTYSFWDTDGNAVATEGPLQVGGWGSDWTWLLPDWIALKHKWHEIDQYFYDNERRLARELGIRAHEDSPVRFTGPFTFYRYPSIFRTRYLGVLYASEDNMVIMYGPEAFETLPPDTLLGLPSVNYLGTWQDLPAFCSAFSDLPSDAYDFTWDFEANFKIGFELDNSLWDVDCARGWETGNYLEKSFVATDLDENDNTTREYTREEKYYHNWVLQDEEDAKNLKSLEESITTWEHEVPRGAAGMDPLKLRGEAYHYEEYELKDLKYILDTGKYYVHTDDPYNCPFDFMAADYLYEAHYETGWRAWLKDSLWAGSESYLSDGGGIKPRSSYNFTEYERRFIYSDGELVGHYSKPTHTTTIDRLDRRIGPGDGPENFVQEWSDERDITYLDNGFRQKEFTRTINAYGLSENSPGFVMNKRYVQHWHHTDPEVRTMQIEEVGGSTLWTASRTYEGRERVSRGDQLFDRNGEQLETAKDEYGLDIPDADDDSPSSIKSYILNYVNEEGPTAKALAAAESYSLYYARLGAVQVIVKIEGTIESTYDGQTYYSDFEAYGNFNRKGYYKIQDGDCWWNYKDSYTTTFGWESLERKQYNISTIEAEVITCNLHFGDVDLDYMFWSGPPKELLQGYNIIIGHGMPMDTEFDPYKTIPEPYVYIIPPEEEEGEYDYSEEEPDPNQADDPNTNDPGSGDPTYDPGTSDYDSGTSDSGTSSSDYGDYYDEWESQQDMYSEQQETTETPEGVSYDPSMADSEPEYLEY
jgi:hypothetical protein